MPEMLPSPALLQHFPLNNVILPFNAGDATISGTTSAFLQSSDELPYKFSIEHFTHVIRGLDPCIPQELFDSGIAGI